MYLLLVHHEWSIISSLEKWNWSLNVVLFIEPFGSKRLLWELILDFRVLESVV
jgi:hypothetical protein